MLGRAGKYKMVSVRISYIYITPFMIVMNSIAERIAADGLSSP